LTFIELLVTIAVLALFVTAAFQLLIGGRKFYEEQKWYHENTMALEVGMKFLGKLINMASNWSELKKETLPGPKTYLKLYRDTREFRYVNLSEAELPATGAEKNVFEFEICKVNTSNAFDPTEEGYSVGERIRVQGILGHYYLKIKKFRTYPLSAPQDLQIYKIENVYNINFTPMFGGTGIGDLTENTILIKLTHIKRTGAKKTNEYQFKTNLTRAIQITPPLIFKSNDWT